MSRPNESHSSDENETDEAPLNRDLAQVVGAVAVIAGILLVAASSAGWVSYNAGIRYVLLIGTALLLGWKLVGP